MIVCYDAAQNEDTLDGLLLQELVEKTGRTTRNARTISFAFEEGGEYAGGILAKTIFESCYIDLLAVKKEFRGKGIARHLLEELDNHLRAMGIHTVYLNTQDYQAKGFYLKMGYTLAGQMEDVPFAGTTRYYFVKRL